MGRKFEVRKVSMAKTAAAKTKVYSKYGKEIYVVAKNGGVDPTANLSLKRLIEKAKKDQVPAHVIDKAIDKAAGGGGEDFAPARYEGFGPGGCMVVFSFAGDDDEVVLEALMEADVDIQDVEVEEGVVTVFVPHTEFFKAKTALQESFDGIEFDVEECGCNECSHKN